ncbi:MAG: sigma-70 family RNA polymerase sigma factor [Leptolyngbya sp. SIO1D8]|nr:sigma-70 family RNA polymerase sigma factor [Leptolyngbya sp. SIO1D8]
MNPFLKEYTTDKTDEELIHLVQEGDRESLEELLMKHQPYIYNIAWKMVRDPDDAADLAQEAMIKVTVNLSKFRFNSTFRTWAYRIVVNHFLSAKKRAMETMIKNFDDMAHNLNNTPDQELSAVEQEEYRRYIREMNLMCMSGMLLCLNREQRLIYIIGEMFGADHTIGSEMMNISKDNFRAKLRKSRKDLYHFMNNQCGLVNKANPCRCHKKVSFALSEGHIDAKELLHNRKEFSSFREYIREDANRMMDYADQKYSELYWNMTFKKDFDKKLFIEEILGNIEVRSKLNLD